MMTLDVNSCIWGDARRQRDGLYPPLRLMPPPNPQCAFGRLSRFGVLPVSGASKLRFSCPKCSAMLSYVTTRLLHSGPLHVVSECRKMLFLNLECQSIAFIARATPLFP
jgi:hypothetical protein